MRFSLLLCTLFLLAATTINAQSPQIAAAKDLPPGSVPSGRQMFRQYCAPCHGQDAKGHGPARAARNIPAADLTTLAKRHDGKFPDDYVSNVLRFGIGFNAHGCSDMPSWGTIFRYMDNQNEAIVHKRVRNLCEYIASIQEK